MNPSRISREVGIMMIVVAFVIDCIQALVTLLAAVPFIGFAIVAAVNFLISFVTAMLFGIWCSHMGVSLLSAKRSLGFLSTIVGESIPFVDGMFWWTIFISYTVITEWRRKTDI